MGSLFLLQILFVLQLILVALLRYIAPRRQSCIKYYRRFKHADHPNAIFARFILEGYIEFLLCGLITVENLRSSDLIIKSFSDSVDVLIGFMFFMSSALMPAAIAYILHRRINFLEQKHLLKTTNATHKEQYKVLIDEERNFDKKWQIFYEQLNPDYNFAQQYYLIYCLRRFTFVMLCYYLYKYPGLQLQINVLMVISMLMYLIQTKPFVDREQNVMDVFNELFLLMISYALFCMSDFVSDAKTKNMTGYFIMGVTFISIIFNASAIVRSLFWVVLKKFRRWRWKREYNRIQSRIIEKYPIRDQKLILESMRSGRSLADVTRDWTRRRLRFQQQHLPHFIHPSLRGENNPLHTGIGAQGQATNQDMHVLQGLDHRTRDGII